MRIAVIVGLAVLASLGSWFLLPKLFVRYFVKGQALTKELLEKGIPAAAIVLQIRDTGVTINENPQVEFLLEVRPEGRAPYQAQTTALVSRLSVPKYQPGAVVKVLFDPQDPSRVALVGT